MSDMTHRPFSSKTNRPSMQGPQTGAAPGTATLPKAGHAQREIIKQRVDAMEEQAATQFANVDAVNPDRFEVERELAQHFNELEVTNADPNFVYRWINFSSNGGIALRRAIAPPERWEVVTGDMPEASELRAVDGTRKLGDVLLVRMSRKRYDILEKVKEEQRQRQQGGYENNLRELGRRNPKAIKVYGQDNMPPEMTKRLTNPSQNAINAMRGAEAAAQQFDGALREGALNL